MIAYRCTKGKCHTAIYLHQLILCYYEVLAHKMLREWRCEGTLPWYLLVPYRLIYGRESAEGTYM
jgi:hypothetical protein